MARVVVTLEDMEGGQYDGGVAVRSEWEPAIPVNKSDLLEAIESLTNAQRQGLSMIGYLNSRYEVLMSEPEFEEES